MAGPTTWARTRGKASVGGLATDISAVNVPVGTTMLRIHGGFDFMFVLPGYTDYSVIDGTRVVAGLYTTLTTGGTTLNPGTQQGDFNPPLQRWLWWEQLTPFPLPNTGKQHPDSPQLWSYPTKQNPLDIEAQVTATMAFTVHLALSLSVVPQGLRYGRLYYWLSVLYR